ncbi:winged helix-turn-helix domain-containing protein [Shewanella subflava]|uniref:Winged helix-turn-helix domain-containing protein n=1 Tax=Shewanella subflava TaxID=2986476 RepID=A0ABT3I630_9GAMM|nr:winged helix-turn-helix domain-containing protein [Shewanella subflava]MCW3171516.1 winged helix-turn-helix domain-containing protein [Shewanella subflava]
MDVIQYQIGPCTLDCSIMTLSCGSQSVKLSAKVFELLKLFIESPDHIVSRQTAIDIIWDGNQGVGEKGFTNSVWLIRKSFKDLNIEDDLLLTLPKLGYQLVLPICAISVASQQVNIAEEPKPARILPKWIGISFGLIFVLLLGFSGYQFKLSHQQQTAQLPVSITPIKNKVTNFEGVEEHIAVSNNGNYLAMQWRSGDLLGKIYIKDLNNADSPLKLISFGEYEEASPTWSPSDEKLAYVRLSTSGDCEVRVRHLLQNTDSLIAEGCFYLPYKRVLSWSTSDENTLVFAKQLNDRVALFAYSFITQQVTPLTQPGKNEIDFAPHQLDANNGVAFIREKSSSMQMSLILQNNENQLIDILANKVTIVDFDYSVKNKVFYVNHVDAGGLAISEIDIAANLVSTITHEGLPSSISFSDIANTLYITEHISKEYIAQVAYQDQKVLRTISSSSRDMYARYLKSSADVLFLSNRSSLWSIWKNNQINSKNLTKNMGNAGVVATSPTDLSFAVTINADEKQTLFIGNTESELFESVDIGELAAENISWSKDGKALYFKGTQDDKSAIYRYSLNHHLEPIKFGQGNYAVEGETPDILYMSRFNVNGIWRFDARTNQSIQITDRLAKYDFGSFYFENGYVYFVERSKLEDKIQRINADHQVQTIMTFPANSIRKFFGISSADEASLLLTLKVANEADVTSYELPVKH